MLKPRMAPALFGLGLLEAVPGKHSTASGGRFGWQGAALSIRDQTTRALAREMGVTNTDRPVDDCTAAETQCLGSARSRPGDVSRATRCFVDVREVAVGAGESDAPGSGSTGCWLEIIQGHRLSQCHRPEQRIRLVKMRWPIAAGYHRAVHGPRHSRSGAGSGGSRSVRRRASHALAHPAAVEHGYRVGREKRPSFLHDGRARFTGGGGVLWQDGEAAVVRERFEHLPRAQRELVLKFVGSL